MSIRPVDVPVLLHRSSEVDRVQQARDQQGQTSQQQFGLQMKSELERREIQVRESPRAEKGHVDPDGGRDRDKRGRADKGPANAAQQRPGSEGEPVGGAAGKDHNGPPRTGGRLDIRI